jgi:hypothetical protein
MAIVPLVSLATLLPNAWGEAEKPRPDLRMFEVRLIDSSQVNLRLLTEQIEIVTAYGKLKVPVGDIQRIDIGRRYPKGGQKQQEPDVIRTTRFPIAGQIEELVLKVYSPVFGERQLRLADMQQMRSLAAEMDAVPGMPRRLRPAVPDPGAMGRPASALFQVRLTDGSLIDVQPLAKEIEVVTAEDKKQVPLADVRRIEFGLRYPEGVENQVRAAVSRLGDADFRTRRNAGIELLRLKVLAYPALERAMHSKDPETRQRATNLVRQLKDQIPDDLVGIRDQDVIVTPRSPITGRIEGLVLRVRSPILGEGQLRLSDMREMLPLTVELMTARPLLAQVREAVSLRRTTQTERLGSGSYPYEEVPKEGALLTGFEVTYGKFGDSPTVTTFRPIFLTRRGRLLGTTHGRPGAGVIRVEAKPGYAVGAVTIKAGLGVDGMSVTFMEICDGGLNTSHAYESAWLGGMGGDRKRQLGGSGAPIVGIFGATAEGASTFNGLGLVTAAMPK